MEEQKWKNKAKINLRVLVFLLIINFATLKIYIKFEHFGSHRSRETCDRKFVWREIKIDK